MKKLDKVDNVFDTYVLFIDRPYYKTPLMVESAFERVGNIVYTQMDSLIEFSLETITNEE